MWIKDLRRDFYEVIIRGRVLVLVNYDVDALCALRILQFLFETDNVQYTVVPVSTEMELAGAYMTHRDNVKGIILINMGGTFDVLGDLEHESDVPVFIADSHRPYSLHNIYRDEVGLLAKKDDSVIPSYEQSIGLMDSIDELPDNDRNRRRLAKAQEDINKYLSQSYYGQATAIAFYTLAWKMSKESNYLLWLAIVALYDQYMNSKIDRDQFESDFHFLKGHVSRLSHVREERVGGALDEMAGGDGESNTATPRSHTLAIKCESQLNFILYRNWSLMESMRHTPDVCCFFKVWTPRGEKRLLEFFAELGIPLTQCRQKFAAMDLEYRKNLQDWIKALIDNGDNVHYKKLGKVSEMGFVASRGFTSKYSANDIALGVRALLENPEKSKPTNEKFIDALKALSWLDSDVIEKGLELARLQLEAILKQIQYILDLNDIGKAGPFFYIVIKEGAPDARIFSYPGPLIMLARFLQKAFVTKTRLQNAELLPFVIIAPDVEQPGTGYVAGIPSLNNSQELNFFSTVFRLLTELDKLSFELTPELYDGCVVRIPYNDKNIRDLIAAMAQTVPAPDLPEERPEEGQEEANAT